MVLDKMVRYTYCNKNYVQHKHYLTGLRSRVERRSATSSSAGGAAAFLRSFSMINNYVHNTTYIDNS